MAQVGLSRTISMWSLCLCLHNVPVEFADYFHVAVHMNMYTKLRTCRSIGNRFLIFMSGCNASAKYVGSWYLPVLTSEATTHTVSKHISKAPRSYHVWELVQSTLHNFWKHEAWNLKLCNLAGWQQVFLRSQILLTWQQVFLRSQILLTWQQFFWDHKYY